jgi:hypothetical protein
VRERKAGSFYACEKEGCEFDAPASDLAMYAPRTRVAEEALEHAIAQAAMAPPRRAGKTVSARKRTR